MLRSPRFGALILALAALLTAVGVLHLPTALGGLFHWQNQVAPASVRPQLMLTVPATPSPTRTPTATMAPQHPSAEAVSASSPHD